MKFTFYVSKVSYRHWENVVTGWVTRIEYHIKRNDGLKLIRYAGEYREWKKRKLAEGHKVILIK